MSDLLTYWNQFWFEGPGGAPFDFSIARILIIGYYLFFKLNDRAFDLWAWQRARENFEPYWKRAWLLEKLGVGFAGRRLGYSLIVLYKVSLFMACIGLFTQYSSAIALVCGLYVMGMRHGLKLHHTVIPIHFMMLAFAAVPGSVHVFSVDAWLGLYATATDPQLDWSLAHWGLQTIRVTFAFVIFSTGVAKIRNIARGEGFVAARNLATIIRIHDYPHFYVHPLISIGKLLLRYRWAEKAASISTIIIELGFPLVLFSDYARIILVPGMVGFLFGFRIFMGPRFDVFTVSLIAAFTPWSKFFLSGPAIAQLFN